MSFYLFCFCLCLQTDFDYKNTKESLTSPSVKLEKDRVASEREATLAREYANQLRAQVRHFLKSL